MRLTVSKRTDLAIRACRYLHEHQGRVPGRQVADAVGTSVPFLSQVLTPLVAGGWIDSRTGPSGGYQLRNSGEELTLLEVVQAVEGPMVDGHCVLDHSACDPTNPCVMHTMWSGARKGLMESLRDVRVLD
jgi:Rrf2 family protein